MTLPVDSWAPEACALPTVERPLREREFAELFRVDLRSAALLAPTRAEFVLNPSSRERLTDLIARERACCSFFTFTVTDTPHDLRMVVEVPDQYAEVVAALVASAGR